MYKLTLTSADRKAIDWIGHRYFHGDNLFKLLCRCYPLKDDREKWGDDKADITFHVLEHVAWMIQDGLEKDGYRLACFSPELKAKLIRFCDEII